MRSPRTRGAGSPGTRCRKQSLWWRICRDSAPESRTGPRLPRRARTFGPRYPRTWPRGRSMFAKGSTIRTTLDFLDAEGGAELVGRVLGDLAPDVRDAIAGAGPTSE